MTIQHWYLAHICGIKSDFIINGEKININKGRKDHLFSRGELSDWKKDSISGKYINKRDYGFTNEEKSIIKAHFLRFIHPLNYCLVPGTKYQKNSVFNDKQKNIGEYEKLTNYVFFKYKEIYGNKVMDDFSKLIFMEPLKFEIYDNKIINIEYSNKKINVITKNCENSNKNNNTSKNKNKSGVGQQIKKRFESLLENNKLSQQLIDNLMDKKYCKRFFGIA